MMQRMVIAATLATSLARAFAMDIVEDAGVTGTLTIMEGSAKVLSYNYGDKLPAGVDKKYIRSGYIHPLWGLSGKVLTEDFPPDHRHHHGVFWGWPIVKTRGVTTDNWMPGSPLLRQRFVNWTERNATSESAVLGVENRWHLEGKGDVVKEEVKIVAGPAKASGRFIDISIRLEALGEPVTLQGSQEDKKGYGGFSFRADPAFKGAQITTDAGARAKDIMMETAKWSDLSNGADGVAIFVKPNHPDYPPFAFARNSYAGFLNPSWPGLESTELIPGIAVTLGYRIFVHKGNVSKKEIDEAYYEFVKD